MVTIEIDGLDELNRQLREYARRGNNMSPILTDIGEHMVNSTHDNFESSSAPDGNAWSSKSPVTMANYLGSGGSRPLIDTHTLMQSISYEVGSREVTIGTNIVYGAMMHFGGTKSAYPNLWGDIPARPFLGVKDEDKRIVLEMAGDYLMGGG